MASEVATPAEAPAPTRIWDVWPLVDFMILKAVAFANERNPRRWRRLHRATGRCLHWMTATFRRELLQSCLIHLNAAYIETRVQAATAAAPAIVYGIGFANRGIMNGGTTASAYTVRSKRRTIVVTMTSRCSSAIPRPMHLREPSRNGT